MRLLVSRLLIGLLVTGWLSINFGRGTAKLALELILGLLEFSQALAETTGKLGKLFCSEQQVRILVLDFIDNHRGAQKRRLGR